MLAVLYPDWSQGWWLTALSSLLCISGCFIIFLDDVYHLVAPKWVLQKYTFNLKENYMFMNGSLAFSCGCLLLTALYRLLPEASAYILALGSGDNANAMLVASFIAGIVLCVCFNYALHLVTSNSVVHCSHDGEARVGLDPHDGMHSSKHDHAHPSGHSHLHSHGTFAETTDGLGEANGHFDPTKDDHVEESNAVAQDRESYFDSMAETQQWPDETHPLLSHRKSNGIIHYLAHDSNLDENILGECKGYSSAERCIYERTGELHFCEIPELHLSKDPSKMVSDTGKSTDYITEVVPPRSNTASSAHSHHNTAEHHHHHVNSPRSRLLLIGIQTMLAITLHKLPEGFITYVTSETNPDLGFSIFLSLLIHNYTEGFLMCLPLYYSFGAVKWRKLKSVGISATLGGLSQPLGAVLGYTFMKYYAGENFDLKKLDLVFGVSMASTAGFLAVIAFSMYGSAVSFCALPNFVLLWCLFGMCLIGILTVFT